MSDALCGSSNALQNFQKHASIDRTLQQDRSISRESPSHGFRSQNPIEGAFDPEFTAFESNLTGPPLPSIQHASHFVPPKSNLAVSSPAEAPSWAADFQKMHISGPSHPLRQLSGASVSPISTVSQRGWHNEFARQQQHQTTSPKYQPHVSGLQPSFAPQYPRYEATFTPTYEPTGNEQLPTEIFDEPAFEAAFEQARADMLLQVAETTQDDLEYIEEGAESGTITEEGTQENLKIGSDITPQAVKNDQQVRVNDADELARTAGQLLESVKHDQSQKFRESNFLALMRRIRDREVHIDGDEIREVSTSP
ncbi:peroxin-20 [Aspergillus ellipticus CBS 707.79]|uniref:Peroxin-20 n=1 Tax=Aspergillus ellipticus CBS 707.79 TaxID=1448320 RepID=A0A319EA03_9EURO|nr:peroxin-20 [Aspergillus ellipticus CBS 707.79]